MGKNAAYRHDKVNKFICSLVREETTNYQYEPVTLDAHARDRRHIIVHDEFEQQNNKYARFYVDTHVDVFLYSYLHVYM